MQQAIDAIGNFPATKLFFAPSAAALYALAANGTSCSNSSTSSGGGTNPSLLDKKGTFGVAVAEHTFMLLAYMMHCALIIVLVAARRQPFNTKTRFLLPLVGSFPAMFQYVYLILRDVFEYVFEPCTIERSNAYYAIDFIWLAFLGPSFTLSTFSLMVDYFRYVFVIKQFRTKKNETYDAIQKRLKLLSNAAPERATHQDEPAGVAPSPLATESSVATSGSSSSLSASPARAHVLLSTSPEKSQQADLLSRHAVAAQGPASACEEPGFNDASDGAVKVDVTGAADSRAMAPSGARDVSIEGRRARLLWWLRIGSSTVSFTAAFIVL